MKPDGCFISKNRFTRGLLSSHDDSFNKQCRVFKLANSIVSEINKKLG